MQYTIPKEICPPWSHMVMPYAKQIIQKVNSNLQQLPWCFSAIIPSMLTLKGNTRDNVNGTIFSQRKITICKEQLAGIQIKIPSHLAWFLSMKDIQLKSGLR
jgi:hypothetical protein